MGAQVSFYDLDLVSADKERPAAGVVRIAAVCERPRWIQL